MNPLNMEKLSIINNMGYGKLGELVKSERERQADLVHQVLELPVADLERDTEQPRKNFDEAELNELAESIREFGLLQPILVRKAGDKYRIVAGERRWRAAQAAGLETIRAILMVENEKTDVGYVQMVENMARADLKTEEVAEFIAARLPMEKQSDIARKLGISKPEVSKYAAWSEITDDIKAAVKDGRISGISVAYEAWLLKKQHPEALRALLSTGEIITKPDIMRCKKTFEKQAPEIKKKSSEVTPQTTAAEPVAEQVDASQAILRQSASESAQQNDAKSAKQNEANLQKQKTANLHETPAVRGEVASATRANVHESVHPLASSRASESDSDSDLIFKKSESESEIRSVISKDALVARAREAKATFASPNNAAHANHPNQANFAASQAPASEPQTFQHPVVRVNVRSRAFQGVLAMQHADGGIAVRLADGTIDAFAADDLELVCVEDA